MKKLSPGIGPHHEIKSPNYHCQFIAFFMCLLITHYKLALQLLTPFRNTFLAWQEDGAGERAIGPPEFLPGGGGGEFAYNI
jgi:hypothetical protein